MPSCLQRNKGAGACSPHGYERFTAQMRQTEHTQADFLLTSAGQGKKAEYATQAKSAALLHYWGFGKRLIEFTAIDQEEKE